MLSFCCHKCPRRILGSNPLFLSVFRLGDAMWIVEGGVQNLIPESFGNGRVVVGRRAGQLR